MRLRWANVHTQAVISGHNCKLRKKIEEWYLEVFRIPTKLRWQKEKDLAFHLMRFHFFSRNNLRNRLHIRWYSLWAESQRRFIEPILKSDTQGWKFIATLIYQHKMLFIRSPRPFFLPFFLVGSWRRFRRCLEYWLCPPGNAERQTFASFWFKGKC